MKKMLLAAIMGISLLMVDGVSYALQCPVMQVEFVNVGAIRLRNVTGGACGNMANNAVLNFIYDGNNADRQIAIALTALSLEKTVFADFSGDGSAAGVLNSIAVSR
jgi:hypothetical protein